MNFKLKKKVGCLFISLKSCRRNFKKNQRRGQLIKIKKGVLEKGNKAKKTTQNARVLTLETSRRLMVKNTLTLLFRPLKMLFKTKAKHNFKSFAPYSPDKYLYYFYKIIIHSHEMSFIRKWLRVAMQKSRISCSSALLLSFTTFIYKNWFGLIHIFIGKLSFLYIAFPPQQIQPCRSVFPLFNLAICGRQSRMLSRFFKALLLQGISSPL